MYICIYLNIDKFVYKSIYMYKLSITDRLLSYLANDKRASTDLSPKPMNIYI
jgi:hypothetical protein